MSPTFNWQKAHNEGRIVDVFDNWNKQTGLNEAETTVRLGLETRTVLGLGHITPVITVEITIPTGGYYYERVDDSGGIEPWADEGLEITYEYHLHPKNLTSETVTDLRVVAI